MATIDDRGWVATDHTFGARLAMIRQRMGWGNLKEAALACGVPVQNWRGWECHGVMPRDLVGIAHKIAAATGCDPLWLAGFQLPRLDSNQQPSVCQIRPVELDQAA